MHSGYFYTQRCFEGNSWWSNSRSGVYYVFRSDSFESVKPHCRSICVICFADTVMEWSATGVRPSRFGWIAKVGLHGTVTGRLLNSLRTV